MSPTPSGQSKTLGSVDKAISVLEYLAGSDVVALADLATALDINKSTLHHCLTTLRDRGWVEQDSAGRYRVGPASAVLAHWWNSSSQLTSSLHPALERICTASQETTHLGQLLDDEVIYLDKVEPNRPVRVVSRVGRTVPAATTALGRAILGSTLAVDDQPPHLRESLARVRTEGYAVESEENEPGIACVGVPVLFNGQVAAAISITMPVERSRATRVAFLAELIADEIDELGLTYLRAYRPSRP